MRKVFTKVVNSNHQECIDYLMSLGGKNWSNWRGTAWADSYCINSNGNVGWASKNGWRWYAANGYTEVFLPETPSKRHPHYDLIVQWASDISQNVWGKQINGEYVRLEYPSWMPKLDYHIGETPPPNLEPVLFEDVCVESEYFVVDFSENGLYQYTTSGNIKKHLFDRKLVYSTPEGAVNRANEMLGIDE